MFDALKAIGDLTTLLRAARDQAKRIENLEIVGQLTDAQMQVADLKDEIIRLRETVSELQRKLDLEKAIVYDEPSYYVTKDDGSKDGPFCQKCHDDKRKLARTRDVEYASGTFRVCTVCNTRILINPKPREPRDPRLPSGWVRSRRG